MSTGLGIRPELFEPTMAQRPAVDFLEAHSENYFQPSINRTRLLELREYYPFSLHGVGLSLGRADDLDRHHLAALTQLVTEIQPDLISEHLAWSAYSHRHVPDLLPLPLTHQSLETVCSHINQMQDALGRQILIENPSNYLVFDLLQIPEPEFLNELADRTGCGLLLDVNNVYVSAMNLNRSAQEFLAAINPVHVKQMHLAGHIERDVKGQTLLIDTHNQTVDAQVWQLYEYALQRFGNKPTVIEWDSDFPPFEVLLRECETLKKHQRETPSPVTQTTKIRPLSQQRSSDEPFELAELQADFLDQILLQSESIERAGDGHSERIWVYQNNVFGALNDYLAEVYPATRGVVGEDFFKYLCNHYVKQVAPASGNIYDYGADFGQSVCQLEALQEMPYLSALTEYEWALHVAYFAELEPALDPSDYTQEELLNLPVQFNSSVWFRHTDYPVYEIHGQSLPDYDGDVRIDLSQSQDALLVCKHQQSVHTQVVDPEIVRFLQSVKKSETLLQAINRNVGSITQESLTAGLSMCFELGLLSLHHTEMSD